MSIQGAIDLATEALIKPFEGFHKLLPDGRVCSYPDPGTHDEPWTIGYGSTGPEINRDSVWTQEQCLNALRAEVYQKTMGLLKLSPALIDVSERRFAALISFAYNCGLGNYRVSTLKRMVDKQDWEEASKQILKWNKAAGRILPGLTKRRIAESKFLN